MTVLGPVSKSRFTYAGACLLAGLFGAGAGAAGCDSSSGASASTTDPAQFPPEGAAAVETWLQGGAYKQWHCEAASHDARSPSPHLVNRICSNDAIAKNASGSAAWPKGAAAVKELLPDATSMAPVGYAVYAKKQSDSAGGGGWYWYERVPLDSPAPHDAAGVVADGAGAAICVSCHGAAGSNAEHTPSPGGRDQVYTPVPAN